MEVPGDPQQTHCKDDLLFNSYTTYCVLGQGSNPFVGGVVNNGVTYLDPRLISCTTTLSF